MNNAVFPIVLEAPSIALNYLSIKFLFLDITEKLALLSNHVLFILIGKFDAAK